MTPETKRFLSICAVWLCGALCGGFYVIAVLTSLAMGGW